VLIPRIEYRTQHMHLSEKTCNDLTAMFRKVFKNKALLKSHISALFYQLNNNETSGIATIIRLKQSQIKCWEPGNILSNSINFYKLIKGNLAAMILALAKSIQVTFQS
ncbi:16780_t:CDS:2, partial [Acaulospora colombiana]